MTLFTPDSPLGDIHIDIDKLNLPPTRAEFTQFQRSEAVRIIGRPRWSDFFTFRRCRTCLTRLNWSEADIRE